MDKSLILAWAKEYIQIHSKLGVQVGFYSSGMVEQHCFGQASKESIFDVASVSKAFMTSYLCMIAVEKDLIKLNTKVSEIFKCSKDISDISISELLTHTSGLKAWLPMYGLVSSAEQARDYLLNLEILPENRGQRVYSDLGFIILGFILEDIFKERLDVLFNKNIINPLGLKNTFFQNNLNKDSMTTSFGNPFEKQLVESLGIENLKSISWRNYPIKNEVNDFNCFSVFKGISGHCGLFSNSNDMIEISKSIIFNKIVSKKTRDTFLNKLIQNNSLGFLASPKLMKFSLNENWRGHHGFTGCSVFINVESLEAFSFLSNRQVVGLEEKNYGNWKMN